VRLRPMMGGRSEVCVPTIRAVQVEVQVTYTCPHDVSPLVLADRPVLGLPSEDWTDLVFGSRQIRADAVSRDQHLDAGSTDVGDEAGECGVVELLRLLIDGREKVRS